MYGILIFFFILVCVALSVVILLQSSKGGGLAGAFGGAGDMGAVFGGRGAATFLSRLTTILAVAFLGFSLLLSFINKGSSEATGLVQKEQQKRAAAPASGLPLVPTNDAGALLPLDTGDGPATTPADSGK